MNYFDIKPVLPTALFHSHKSLLRTETERKVFSSVSLYKLKLATVKIQGDNYLFTTWEFLKTYILLKINLKVLCTGNTNYLISMCQVYEIISHSKTHLIILRLCNS